MQPCKCYCGICTVRFNSRSCCMFATVSVGFFSLSEQKAILSLTDLDGIYEIKTTYGSSLLGYCMTPCPLERLADNTYQSTSRHIADDLDHKHHYCQNFESPKELVSFMFSIVLLITVMGKQYVCCVLCGPRDVFLLARHSDIIYKSVIVWRWKLRMSKHSATQNDATENTNFHASEWNSLVYPNVQNIQVKMLLLR